MDSTVFCNITANVKVIINHNIDPVIYLHLLPHSFIEVTVKNPNNILEYINAVAEVVNAVLNYESHINVKYRVECEKNEKKETKFYYVKFSLMCIISSYILHHFVQVLNGMPENKIKTSFLEI